MAISSAIGLTCAGLTISVVLAGRALLRRRSLPRRAAWITPLLALQPMTCVGVSSGDCGYTLRSLAILALIVVTVSVALAVAWPRSGEYDGVARRSFCGALAGGVLGLPLASVQYARTWSCEGADSLAASTLGGAVIAGALVGLALTPRESDKGKAALRLGRFLLLPAALAPLLSCLVATLPYQAAVTTSPLFHFVAIDASTGLPVPDAVVRPINPEFSPGDADREGPKVVTGLDGKAKYFLSANLRGRAGVLRRTEVITFDPYLVQVEAPGYRPFLASLAPAPPGHDVDPPLGLTFPPPPSATIRLTPVNAVRETP